MLETKEVLKAALYSLLTVLAVLALIGALVGVSTADVLSAAFSEKGGHRITLNQTESADHCTDEELEMIDGTYLVFWRGGVW